MTSTIILVVLVFQIGFAAVGLFVWLRSSKKPSATASATEQRLAEHCKRDSSRCQQILDDISGTLSSHNAFLELFQDPAVFQRGEATSLRTDDQHLGRQLNSQVDELGELLEPYDDAFRHERLKLQSYAGQAEEVERMLGMIVADSTVSFEPFLEMVQTMMSENRQLRATVKTCQTQISELIVRAIRSDRDARVDPLTQLPNRRAWVERMESLNEEEEYAIAVMDLDNFKDINDQYGHAAGDSILMLVARVLREDLHCTAFRNGGDEFIVYTRSSRSDEARARIDSIRQRIQRASVTYQQQRLRITVTFGIALALPGEPVASVVHRADSALYQAKAYGKNCLQLSEGCDQLVAAGI